MEFLEQYVIDQDDRGSFNGIVNKYGWGEVNLIKTKADVVRGGHYHRFTKELFFIIEGKIEVVVRHIVTKENWTFTAVPNSAFIIDPYEVHTFTTMEYSSWLNMLSHKLDEDNPDLVRMPETSK
jgi:dTDP-4-dehydrorhamnose 3,5-epimerase-like enzyme